MNLGVEEGSLAEDEGWGTPLLVAVVESLIAMLASVFLGLALKSCVSQFASLVEQAGQVVLVVSTNFRILPLRMEARS